MIGADGGFSLGQFWFLLYLFVISVLGCGIINLSKKIELKSKFPFWLVCLLGFPMPILSKFLSIGGKSLIEFMYLFLLGYFVFSEEKIIKKTEKFCWLLFFIGFLATILNIYLFLFANKNFPVANTICKYVSEWIMIIALIGLAKKYLNFNGKVSNYMNKMSFLFYIYHFVWVVFFQFMLFKIEKENNFVLFLGTVLFSYLATFISCKISIKIPFLCFLTGTKCGAKNGNDI